MTIHPLEKKSFSPALVAAVFPWLLGLSLALFPASRGAAITSISPLNLAEVARGSDAVVLARAAQKLVLQRGALYFTRQDFVVLEALAGPLRESDLFTLQVPGGEHQGEGWIVPGAPEFEAGESYLLCLRRKAAEETLWLPTFLDHGLLRSFSPAGGGEWLVPIQPSHAGKSIPRSAAPEAEIHAAYEQDVLLGHLSEVLQLGEPWDGSRVSADPAAAEAVLLEAEGSGGLSSDLKAVPDGCVFFSSSNRNFRWRAFDSGGSATIFAEAAGDPSLDGNAFDAVQKALNVWMGVTGSGVNLIYGGPRPRSIACSGGQDSEADLILFGDPCGDIADLDGCSGTLAFGGPRVNGTHAFDGATWLTISGWIVVVNNGSGCLGVTEFTQMLAHELGHGLGFEHFSDSSSMMYARCCNAINTTDRTCLRYTYPAADPLNLRPAVALTGTRNLILARNRVQLAAAIADDGRPANPGRLQIAWRQLSGPGVAYFTDPAAAATTVTFPLPGSYQLAVSAADGQLLGIDAATFEVETFAGTHVELAFQQNVENYRGTSDTTLYQEFPFSNQSASTPLNIDGDRPTGSGWVTQTLIRFDDLFGAGNRQVPPGAAIRSAWLVLSSSNFGDGAALHRLSEDWTDQSTWSSFGGDGIQTGVEADPRVEATAAAGAAVVRVDVTRSLASWSEDPCSNHGWAMLPVGDDGWEFSSSEGQAPPRLEVDYAALAPRTLIAVGDDWLYFEGNQNPPADWNQLQFTASPQWRTGPTGIGYGGNDDATVLTSMRNRYLTLYTRKEFLVGSAAEIGRLILRIDYDDGFIAYLNGQETARSWSLGSPGAAVNRNTAAQARGAGTFEDFVLDLEPLRDGLNVLAVEIHNASLNSSDLSFIPELQAFPVLIDEGDEWKFWRGSRALPAAWNQIDFDDAAWESGPSGIGYGDGDDATVLADMQDSYTSVFCRREFAVSDPQALAGLRLAVIFDDGIVAYVNGEEIGRANMPAGPISRGSTAASGGDLRLSSFFIGSEKLRAGRNLIALSAHNSSLSSSDLTCTPILIPVDGRGGAVVCSPAFQRGDVNDDAGIDIGDAVSLLLHIFRGAETISCFDAGDTNDDGAHGIADVTALLSALFTDGAVLPEPGASCGVDPTPDGFEDCVTSGCRS